MFENYNNSGFKQSLSLVRIILEKWKGFTGTQYLKAMHYIIIVAAKSI